MTGRFQGMLQIVRFNPWFYMAGFAALIGGSILWDVCRATQPPLVSWLLMGALGLAGWWLIASLAVSHVVYDRSDWSRGAWLTALMGEFRPLRVLNVSCGFDETTLRLRSWLPGAEVVPLDLFDAGRLTESSIHRARAFLPPEPGSLRGTPEQWPVPEASFDLVCFLLSAHEFRQATEREALFVRGGECLRPGGCVILAEHVRDAANFIAFGPGFLHFHSPEAWHHSWESAGFQVRRHFRVTPWLRVWCLHLHNS